ncbi:MAG: ATP synthase F1 subunit epsilon [Bacteroidetes bacterium CG12_big_fil_rev_8_21_14_0_65_60_17]|nr:MAG: ATP synthase F1 subunit epsilon [Bacteroidetes bacterium CG12_big_fil_rev_8_21_14_0_65_60_17]
MSKFLHVDIVSPSGSVYSGPAAGVKAPGTAGLFEVLVNHAPMVATFDVGQIVVTSDTSERIDVATSGGFLEVSDNRVTVLAETAELATDIDVARAQAAEERAVKVLGNEPTSEERDRYERALDRARNRLRIAMGAVGHTA